MSVDLAQLGLDGLGRAGRAGLGEGRQERRRAKVVAALVPVDLGGGVLRTAPFEGRLVAILTFIIRIGNTISDDVADGRVRRADPRESSPKVVGRVYIGLCFFG